MALTWFREIWNRPTATKNDVKMKNKKVLSFSAEFILVHAFIIDMKLPVVSRLFMKNFPLCGKPVEILFLSNWMEIITQSAREDLKLVGLRVWNQIIFNHFSTLFGILLSSFEKINFKCLKKR